MAPTTVAGADGSLSIKQKTFSPPQLTVKDCLSSIPAHCFERSALRSSTYIVWDLFVIGCIFKGTKYLETFITPANIPNAHLLTFTWVALWAFYSFFTGLFATGLWVIAHECGHQAFSESKTVNNAVGWVLHSALGVPYHSWRITHAKHHASTAHLTQDQVFVPKTRSQLGLPPLDLAKEDVYGGSVSKEVMNELREALGDSPIGALLGAASYLLVGWPMYLIRNASGQRRYPRFTNHFKPTAVMFAPHQYSSIVISDIGILIWLAAIVGFSRHYDFATVLRVYLIPYLWVNHWLVLITFLQHTDPLLPHYRAPEFTFTRGALSTLDRNLLGDLGRLAGALGAHATHGISETHVLHHVCSKIPHYHAWEATDALRRTTEAAGLQLRGAAGGWAEVYRVFKECKFVEDEGDVVFYKNSVGLAQVRPVVPENNDSGVEVDQ